jgi:transcriptional regulator with XRE-family HTH domain
VPRIGNRDPALVYADRQLAALRILERRARRFGRQEDAAQALGRPQSFVSALETGQRRLDVVELLEIADVYGFEPSELVGPPRDDAEETLHARWQQEYREASRVGRPPARPRGPYKQGRSS